MRRKFVILTFLPLVLAAAFAFAPPVECADCLFPKSCPDYPSCASWSSYYTCGPVFCAPDPRNPAGVSLYQNVERFRLCFNQTGQSCTEYQGMKIKIGEC